MLPFYCHKPELDQGYSFGDPDFHLTVQGALPLRMQLPVLSDAFGNHSPVPEWGAQEYLPFGITLSRVPYTYRVWGDVAGYFEEV
jgi:hypothetical protein